MARDGPKVVSAFSRPALLKALKSGDKTLLTELLDPSHLSAEARENELRIALQTAAGQGETELVGSLLQRGAKTDLPHDKGVPPLLRAVEKGHTEVVRVLLKHKPKVDPNVRDKHERTPLMSAAFNGYNKIIELLLQYGADVDSVDSNKRTTLLILAADSSKGKWNKETVDIVLATKINVEHVDGIGRTALHWAAATSKQDLATVLLHDRGRKRANILATTDRGKTALHLAAENNHKAMVSLLLANGAQTEVTSDGHWTPLLNAAQNGHDGVVDLLLKANANVNARTSSGMTALHWAAENNHVRVLRRILELPGAMKNPKDHFESTPLSRAGQHGHQEIIQELKPHIFGGSLSPHAREACHRFSAAVCDFYFEDKAAVRNVVHRKSVWDVLYGKDSKDPSGNTFAITTNLRDIKPRAPDFRWIHLPANNIAWAEALITKYCLERNFSDPSMFKSLLRLFGQRQHRGRKVHSRFMRPLCQRIGSLNHEDTNTTTRRRHRSKEGRGSPAKSPVPRPLSIVPESKVLEQDSALALFMPYLGWETDFNRKKMSRTIKQVEAVKGPCSIDASKDKDMALIAAYLNDANLHVRRTLDQFKHHSIDTEKRDVDQVVYRYCQEYSFPYQDPENRVKVFMVDQLWLWILGPNLVLTCFPERWNQPRRDVLNLFDGVIENVNSKTRPPIKSTHELAALITDHCSGIFDRHSQHSMDEFRFLEMFELSIGTMTRRETALFRRFEADSALAAQWLRTHGKARSLLRQSTTEADAEDLENEEDSWLDLDEESTDINGENRFVDRLLNIAKEARLLVECKDIQDELATLSMVLRQQKAVLTEAERPFREALAFDDGARFDLGHKLTQQKALIDLHLLDIERMDKQSKAVNISLTQVLDLKQKHANALEARFTRDQAQDTARQGKTIMVFTIVTVIFLPMSFIAAFFAINIIEFPHNSADGGNGLHLGYVSQYVFGIGLGISIPLIVLAFALSNSDKWGWNFKAQLTKLGLKQNGKKPVIAALDPQGEKIGVVIDQPRPSMDSFRYRNLHRVDSGATERSRRSNLLPV